MFPSYRNHSVDLQIIYNNTAEGILFVNLVVFFMSLLFLCFSMDHLQKYSKKAFNVYSPYCILSLFFMRKRQSYQTFCLSKNIRHFRYGFKKKSGKNPHEILINQAKQPVKKKQSGKNPPISQTRLVKIQSSQKLINVTVTTQEFNVNLPAGYQI